MGPRGAAVLPELLELEETVGDEVQSIGRRIGRQVKGSRETKNRRFRAYSNLLSLSM